MKEDAVKNTSFSFGEKKSVHKDAPVFKLAGIGSMLRIIPGIALLAMAPATLSSAIPTMPETESPSKMVTSTPEMTSPYVSTYEIKPEVAELQQPDAPFGWLSLRRYDIQNVVHGRSPMFEYDMLFATSTLANGDNRIITDVFIIRDGQNPSNNPYISPPKVEKLYFHNTGDGKEYYGAYIASTHSDKDGNRKSFTRSEIKIDNNTAMQIINLVKGNTDWENYTGIRLFETNSSQRQETIVY